MDERLARRREQHALAMAGRPSGRTKPLAVGRAAKQRLARAVALHAAATAEPDRGHDAR